MNRIVAREIMLELGQMLDGVGVPFFLMGGTALGAYRDNDFTPTERDIDFGFLAEDMAAMADKIVVYLVRNNFEIETYHRPFDFCRTIVAKKDDVKVDLVSFKLLDDKRFACTPVHYSITEPYAIVHESSLLETYQAVELFGRTWRIPCPIEVYLEREYGDWRTPREDHVSRTRVYNFTDSLADDQFHLEH